MFQDTQAFSGFDRWTHQHDARNVIALQRIHRAGDGEVRFSSSGRAYGKSDVMALDLLQVLCLQGCAAAQVAPAGNKQGCRLCRRNRKACPLFRMMRPHGFDEPQLNLFNTQRMLGLIIKTLQCFCRQGGVSGFAVQTEMFSSPDNGDIQHCFNLPEVFIQHAAQVRKTLVIDRGK